VLIAIAIHSRMLQLPACWWWCCYCYTNEWRLH